MFKPARMKKLKILTLATYSNSVVSSLHEAEIVQFQDISERIQNDAEWKQIMKPAKATAYTGKISSLQMKTTGIIDFLKSAERKEGSMLKSILSMINPPVPEKRDVEPLDAPDLIDYSENILSQVEGKTKTIEERITQLDIEKNENSNALDAASKLKSFDIDFSDLKDSHYVSAIAGKMPTQAFNEFKNEVTTITDKIVISEQSEGKDAYKTLIVVTLKEFGSDVSSLLRKHEFEVYDITALSGKPDTIIRNSESRLNEIDNEKNQLMDNIADIADQWIDDLYVLKEQLEIEKDRNEIFSSFGETEKTLMLEAWVPEKKLDKTVEIINTASEGHSIIEVTDPEKGDDIPIQLDNPRFAKPYELFVNMYSPPRYKETDPTILFALVFPFFFGFCLTDAGYGVLDAVIGLVLVFGLGKVNKVMRSLGMILVACGIWATILGLVTNSLFGDFIPRWFMGDPNAALATTIPAFNSFVNPVNILLWALIVGVIYTLMGLIIGTMDNIRMGQVREALGEQVVWIILFLGVVLLAIGYMGIVPIMLYVGVALALLALGMLVYFSGALGILDVSGFLGTILSYARLLALCLATGGIATTVNIIANLMTDMVPIAILGVILAAIVSIGGHIVNAAFQTLGAFINSLRLHYVEFFGQFYIGGSTKFRAFRTKRKLTRLGGK
ncbi:V-type ATP synthase subunit I [Methanobacterium sp. ACI-7]|uniref:V-type ATP synthase subunit I n=1 Tax=unclassified Methanobacterium TaxID=2627676 RepID=UPI0039C2372D